MVPDGALSISLRNAKESDNSKRRLVGRKKTYRVRAGIASVTGIAIITTSIIY